MSHDLLVYNAINPNYCLSTIEKQEAFLKVDVDGQNALYLCAPLFLFYTYLKRRFFHHHPTGLVEITRNCTMYFF